MSFHSFIDYPAKGRIPNRVIVNLNLLPRRVSQMFHELYQFYRIIQCRKLRYFLTLQSTCLCFLPVLSAA